MFRLCCHTSTTIHRLPTRTILNTNRIYLTADPKSIRSSICLHHTSRAAYIGRTFTHTYTTNNRESPSATSQQSILRTLRDQAKSFASVSNYRTRRMTDQTTSPMDALLLQSHAKPPKNIEYPYRRRWLPVATNGGNENAPSSSSSTPVAPSTLGVPFSLVSYNMLAQSLVRRELFQYCSKSSLKVGLRKENLLKEIVALHADIICAQEVDRSLYDSWWLPRMGQLGYKAEWGSRKDHGKHGCAIFYKSSKFEVFTSEVIQFSDLLAAPYQENEDNQHADSAMRKGSVYEEMNRPNIAQIVGLKLKEKDSASSSSATAGEPLGLYLTNTHLFWDPRYRFVRLKQCQTLLDQLAQLQQKNGTAFPSILSGDWNVTPDNIIHHYLTERRDLERNEELWTKFLTPAEHGMVRGEEGSPLVEPTPAVPAEELAANSGVSSASLANMMAAVNLTSSEKSAESSVSVSSSLAAPSSSPPPGTSPTPTDEWQPLSSAPIHQLRSKLVTQQDGSVKEVWQYRPVDSEKPSSKVRLNEVQQVLHHSRALPLLRSVYGNYTTEIIPADLKPQMKLAQEKPYCRWTGEPPFTNYTDKFKGTLDYIFLPVSNPDSDLIESSVNGEQQEKPHPWRDIFASQSCHVQPTHVLELPSEDIVGKFTALPNDVISSDHVPIGARFVLKRGKPADSETQSSSSSSSTVLDSVSSLAKSIAASLAPPMSPNASVGPSAASSSSLTVSTSAAATSFAPFSPAHFQSLLTTLHCGRPLHYSATTSSTMDQCKDLLFGPSANASTKPKSGTVWLADEQTKGRGRVEGRSWSSPKNANLYFTLLIQLNDLTWEQQWKELTKMNQAVCLSVAKAVEKNLARASGFSIASLPPQIQPKIKWPNDIWINGKKCSGMLIDSEIMGKDMSVVIGVGINVHENLHHHPDPALRESATSVAQALEDWRTSGSASSAPTPSSLLTPLSREQILADFLAAFESCASQSSAEVLTAYRQFDMLLGQTIVVMPKKREHTSSYHEAKAVDYSENGHLIVERDGKREELVAEEVTIRPSTSSK